MSETRGVLYVATGAQHIEAARASARSVRETNPDLSLALFSDSDETPVEFGHSEKIENPHRRSKVDYLARSPFRETLFLDTDTRVLGDLLDMFRILEHFDLAAAFRSRDIVRKKRGLGRVDVPAAFPEFNTGVLLYKLNPPVFTFLRAWQAAYAETGLTADQRTFREVLWSAEVRLAVLPQRFNTRRLTWVDYWSSGRSLPVILHTNRFHPSKRGNPVARRFRALAGPRL